MKLSLAAIAAAGSLVAADWPAPIVTIDLDLPPAQRWVEFTKEYAVRANGE